MSPLRNGGALEEAKRAPDIGWCERTPADRQIGMHPGMQARALTSRYKIIWHKHAEKVSTLHYTHTSDRRTYVRAYVRLYVSNSSRHLMSGSYRPLKKAIMAYKLSTYMSQREHLRLYIKLNVLRMDFTQHGRPVYSVRSLSPHSGLLKCP